MKTFLINWAIALFMISVTKLISDSHSMGWFSGIIYTIIAFEVYKYVEAKKN